MEKSVNRIIEYPSTDLIQEYIDKFDHDSEIVAVENTLSELFRIYPNNKVLPEILIKVVGINSLYSTNIYATVKVAHHILAQNIDTRLQTGSLELVDEIALININGKKRRNYSFASKYCHWHRPNIFPIYDSFVERLLWFYRENDNFMTFKRIELQQFSHYKEIIEGFRKFYKLTQFDFRNLDKFLWLYGKKHFPNQK